MQIPLASMMHRAQPKRRRAVLPPILTTTAQVQRLVALYVRIVRIWVEIAKQRLLPAYADTLAQNRAIRRDSIPDIDAAIAAADERIVRAVAEFEQAFREWANEQNLSHLRTLIRQIKYATGLELETVIMSMGGVERTIEEALRQNVSLVQSVSDEIRGKISGAVFRGLQRSTPLRQVARELNQATQLGRARALRIASDQTVKLAASLDRERHEQLGITHFKWRHSGKAHPRKEHLARNGKVYKWDSKIGREDPPGWLPFCGCKAQGVVGDDPEEAAAPPPDFAALDREAESYVRTKGIEDNVEFLVAYNRTDGRELTRHSSGEKHHVSFTPEFVKAIENADNQVIAHHNHPSSTSLSGQDVAMLWHYPGLRRLYAHGHDGTSYWAEIAGRQIPIPDLEPRIRRDVHNALQALVTAKEIRIDQAWRTEGHAVMLILQELGAIKYRTQLPSDSNRMAWANLTRWVDEWIAQAKGKYGYA